MGAWAAQIPLLMPRHQIREGMVGLIILALGIGAVGAMLLAGRLINRFGFQFTPQQELTGTRALHTFLYAGVTTILNPAPMRADFNPALLRHVDILIPNESEFIALVRAIILVGGDFWRGLVDWMRDKLVGEGMTGKDDLGLMQVIEEPEAIVEAIFDFYESRGFQPTREERQKMLNL